MPTILNTLTNIVLDIAFPKKCVVCGKLDTLFCEKCLGRVIFLKTQNCPYCFKITLRGRVCKSCKSKSALTGVYVMAHFEEPLKEVIHKYKYESIKALRGDLADIAWPYMEDFPKKAILTCVPSSPKRLAWRGYNQSEEIAKILAKNTGIRFYPNLLKRAKYKTPQTQLKRKERFQNVQDAFKADKKIDLEGKQVVIFDDLVTSGATLDACAREIRKMGATRVWGFVLARNR
jgi:ComF family protein